MGKKTIILLLNFLFLILSISLCQSQYGWTEYGNSYNPLWQSQFPDAYGILDTQRNNITITNGYYTSLIPMSDLDGLTYQPLVAYLNISYPESKGYLIFPNGNYLQIYDENLILVEEINVGQEIVSQIDTLTWTSDNSIAGIWKINSTDLSFKVYIYNTTLSSLVNVFEQNFTAMTNISVAGVRHFGNTVIFMLPISHSGSNFTSKFIKINSSGIIKETMFYNRPYFYSEPLAFVDMDNDGRNEYLTYRIGGMTGGGGLLIFEEDGTIEYNYTSSGGSVGYRKLLDVKMLKTDLTNYWRIAILEGEGWSPANFNTWITVKKLDGTNVWSKSWSGSLSGGYKDAGSFGKIAISQDYNGDGVNDIFMVNFAGIYTTYYWNSLSLKVLSGSDGSVFINNSWLDTGDARGFEGVTSLTIADLTNDGNEEFIYSHQDGYFIYDIYNKILLNSTNATTCGGLGCYSLFSSCIPADLNFDGFQEVICSGRNRTIMFYSGSLNQNAQIISVAYSPSTSIVRLSSVDVIINASDLEGNSPIYYIHKCFNGDNWSVENENNIQSCYYSISGNYNLTIGVRDSYHFGEYNYFSQNILVTEAGTICGNGICETEEINCPSDCVPSNDSFIQLPDGESIPAQIVDTENIDEGLLPTIFYGTLGFFSYSLIPFMVFVFSIFIILILLTIFVIFKRLIKRGFD